MPLNQNTLTSGRHNKRRHELVYIRLETLGSSLSNLNTQAVNERLVAGLFARLLSADGGRPTGNESRKLRADNATLASLEQALSSSLSLGGVAAENANFMSARDNAPSKTGNDDDDSQDEEAALASIRAQILSSPSSIDAEGERLADKCRLSIERLICRLAYPSCHFRASDVSALVRPPCREDCLLTRDVFCPSLNWTNFAFHLRRAFNKTLKSTINSLDLESQGEFDGPIVLRRQQRKRSIDNDHNNKHAEPHKLAQGYNLNSSIHFYWPHERSIENCEHLPPIRPRGMHTKTTSHSINHLEQSRALPNSNLQQFPRDFDNKGNLQAPNSNKPNNYPPNHDRWSWRVSWPTCSNAHLTTDTLGGKSDELAASAALAGERANSNKVNSGVECLTSSDGVDYNGARNSTKSGLRCQMWTSQTPHVHSSSELLFDNMKDAQNYCRNPGGMELRPWCYTLSASVRWEYCDLPLC